MFLPLYSLVMNWVFPFEVILSYRIESFMRTLDVCLAVIICGDNGISCATWCMFWWSTCGFRDIGNLCIGVVTCSWLSGRNFGALFEVLCVGWIDESEIVWCISYNHAHGYLRWQWSIYVTLGFWLICVLRCYSSTNSRAVCDTYRNSPTDWLERITLRWFRTLQESICLFSAISDFGVSLCCMLRDSYVIQLC